MKVSRENYQSEGIHSKSDSSIEFYVEITESRIGV